MHDDVLFHLSSNSNHSDPSLPSKLAKLEARMAGKSIPAAKPPEQSPATRQATTLISDDSSDDDGASDFMIQPNPNKRKASDPEEFNSGKSKSLRGRGRGRGRGGKIKEAKRPSDQSEGPSKVENGEPVQRTSPQEEETRRLQEELKARCASLGEELDKSRNEAANYRETCEKLEKQVKDVKEAYAAKDQKRTMVISDLLIAAAKVERQEARLRIRQESVRLGNLGIQRAGTLLTEAWEDGQALKDIEARLGLLLEQKSAIEKEKKLLKRRSNDKVELAEGEHGVSEEEYLTMEEVYKSRVFTLKREEDNALRDRDRYHLDKACYIRELKRIRDEDGSQFNHFPILNKRYALLNLLGKGGFSEVYKAFDLYEDRYVACKLHSLNVRWNQDKKLSYVRHAIREYNIHKDLVHAHIVRLWDIFEIDNDTFCTVLQYCGGKDLDVMLKSTAVLPEREARGIMMQVFSGLVYLNKRSQRIIHYDLKPGNVLFDQSGAAKLTDFGLSKIVEEEVGSRMELTSQGAGTYWYLPPECFDINETPLISSKVDVWSAGVLFYQMLYGRRPFGHDQTQERILRDNTIMNANRVDFPAKPTVSPEAKEFIRRCLSYNQADRPDVLTASQDPYLKRKA